MELLLDHDVPEDLTYLLQELGHEVLRLREALPQDAADSIILQFAHEHGCVLVSCNRDDFISPSRATSISRESNDEAVVRGPCADADQ